MKALQGMVAALALGAAGVAAGNGPDVRGMKRWQQPGYTLYSSNESMSRVLVDFLPRIQGALVALLPREPRYIGLPVHVYLMPESVWDGYLRTGRSLKGDFVAGRFANYLLIQSNDEDMPARSGLAHQYTHYYLRTRFGDGLPLWFEDGLATMMQSADIYEKFAVLYEPRLPLGQPVLPMEALLRIDRKAPQYAIDDVYYFHYQSQIVVHRGMFRDAQFREQMLGYVADIQRGAKVNEAVARNFGMDAKALGTAMLAHARGRNPSRDSVKYEEQPPVKAGEGTPMAAIDALQFIARILFESGAPAERIARVLTAAESQEPGNPAVRVAWLRLAARQRDDHKIEELTRQLESFTQDPTMARAVGLALFERAHGAADHDSFTAGAHQQLASRAFDLLYRAEQVLPVDPESAWALALLSARLDRDRSFARERLLQAASIAPENTSLVIAMSALEKQ